LARAVLFLHSCSTDAQVEIEDPEPRGCRSTIEPADAMIGPAAVGGI